MDATQGGWRDGELARVEMGLVALGEAGRDEHVVGERRLERKGVSI